MSIRPEIAHLSIRQIAAQLGCSRTSVVSAKRRAAGLCESCASPVAPGDPATCSKCEDKKTESRRKRLGHRPWVKGQRGRPPKSS